MAKQKETANVTPERRKITPLQAERLAALTDLNAKEIVGSTIADMSEKFRWRVDPELFLFRRVCGRVVKRDPATGELRPVPFATVHVEDTDCNLLGYFPVEWPWGWYFPFFCRREEIATVRTDACGNFCVYIPRWEVDWILRFRHERICFPDIFTKPSIRDLLEEFIIPERPVGWPIPPEPDPEPWLIRDGGLTLRRVEQLVGPKVAGQLAAIQSTITVGGKTNVQSQLLDMPAFTQPLPPPLPADIKQMALKEGQKMMAERFQLQAQDFEGFHPERFIGPFRRCRDVLVPEWMPILDVPDITFSVTQDVDGDGDEETIYTESFFDVRWDAGAIPDVTLEASQIAMAGISCDNPEMACEETAIVLAGKMPVHNLPAPADPYIELTTGYARRTNRPHPSGNLVDPLPNPLASSPLAGTFPLYGCNHRPGAVYYRLLYAYRAPGSGAFTSPVPFTGLTWPLYRWVGSPGHLEVLNVAPDSDGWYSILNDADGWLPSHLLLNWPTGAFQNGLYQVNMQLGNAGKAVVHTTADIRVQIDNSAPSQSGFTGLAYRVAGSFTWIDLGLTCPVVSRPAGSDIEFRVSYLATATHLRSFVLSGGGCGGGTPVLTSAPGTAAHWHTDALDNTIANQAIFTLPHTAMQGAYSFHLSVHSRAFNPDDANGFAADWNYDPIHIWTSSMLPVAVVNA
jgi:hypothetical protein